MLRFFAFLGFGGLKGGVGLGLGWNEVIIAWGRVTYEKEDGEGETFFSLTCYKKTSINADLVMAFPDIRNLQFFVYPNPTCCAF